MKMDKNDIGIRQILVAGVMFVFAKYYTIKSLTIFFMRIPTSILFVALWFETIANLIYIIQNMDFNLYVN